MSRNARRLANGVIFPTLTVVCFATGSAGAEHPMDYKQPVPNSDEEIPMIAVRGGTFTVHEADVTVRMEPFWMSRHEITWAEFRPFIEMGLHVWDEHMGDKEPPEALTHDDLMYYPMRPLGAWTQGANRSANAPVSFVTWFAAKQYTRWLSLRTGRFYRLPTEIEWEYVCLADKRCCARIQQDPGKHAWHSGNAGVSASKKGKWADLPIVHPVEQKLPNSWGFYDMRGNVSEWVIDAYVEHPLQEYRGQSLMSSQAVVWTDQVHPRVVKGSSVFQSIEDVRCSFRMPSRSKAEWSVRDPSIPQSVWWHTETPHVGFRIVREPGQPTKRERRRFWNPTLPWIRQDLELLQGAGLPWKPASHVKSMGGARSLPRWLPCHSGVQREHSWGE